MKTITLYEFMKFDPCYSRSRLEEIRSDKERWSALDILALDDVPADDRLWAVLREELIDEMLLHEFGCRCAKHALSLVENPDPRSVRAIEVKRAWMRGEATDAERAAAWHAARAAAEHAAGAAWAAAGAAWAAAGAAAGAAAWAATGAAAGAAAWEAERQWQIDELKKMLKEAASWN